MNKEEIIETTREYESCKIDRLMAIAFFSAGIFSIGTTILKDSHWAGYIIGGCLILISSARWIELDKRIIKLKDLLYTDNA